MQFTKADFQTLNRIEEQTKYIPAILCKLEKNDIRLYKAENKISLLEQRNILKNNLNCNNIGKTSLLKGLWKEMPISLKGLVIIGASVITALIVYISTYI